MVAIARENHECFPCFLLAHTNIEFWMLEIDSYGEKVLFQVTVCDSTDKQERFARMG